MDENQRTNSLRKHCEFLADPRLNGRVPGTEGNRLAREYIRQRFEKIPLIPLFERTWYQEYETAATGEKITAVNVAGLLPSTGVHERHILIGAHYDHLEGIAGADDNASSVAIIIEAAKILAKENKNSWMKSIVFVAFDAEERPFYLTSDMGSVHFFRHSPIDAIDCAVILDLCGHDFPMPGKENVVFIIGTDSSATFAEKVPSIQANNITPIIANDRYVGDKSDYYIFKEAEMPYLFISAGWWPSYHKPSDTEDKLNYTKMQGICDFLVELVRMLMINDLTSEPHDTTYLEAQSLSRLLGQQIPADRSTIDKIAARFKSFYMGRSA